MLLPLCIPAKDWWNLRLPRGERLSAAHWTSPKISPDPSIRPISNEGSGWRSSWSGEPSSAQDENLFKMEKREDIFHARMAKRVASQSGICFPPISFAVAIEVILCIKHEAEKTWNTKMFKNQHEFHQMCWGSWLSVPSCFPKGLKATTSRETNYVVMCVVSQKQFWFAYYYFGGRPVYWECGSSLLFSSWCTRVCSRFQLETVLSFTPYGDSSPEMWTPTWTTHCDLPCRATWRRPFRTLTPIEVGTDGMVQLELFNGLVCCV